MGPRFKVDGWTRELTYHEYLQTAAWWRTRQRVLERSRGACEHCLVAPATQVHHATYARLGHEEDADLVALCDPCHRKCHEAELPPAYPYQVRENSSGWPFPFAVLALACKIDPAFRAEIAEAIPDSEWPGIALSIRDHDADVVTWAREFAVHQWGVIRSLLRKGA